MDKWVGRVALITGASAGIGKGIAEALVKQGMKVVGCARRIDRLKEMESSFQGAKGLFLPVQCDLQDESQILNMFEKIRDTWGGVDVCVNNAGILKISNAPLATGSTEEWRKMMDVNVMALCICTRETIKSLRERGLDDGYIIHLNSLSGHRICLGKDGHFYAMTKHAVKAHTEGLRNELYEMKSGIRVSAISPGVVESEMEGIVRESQEEGAKFHAEMESIQPSDIANTVVYILGSPSYMQVHDVLMRPIKQAA